MRFLLLSILFALPLSASAQEIVKGDNKLDFKIGDELVASYYIGKEVAKPYWWPLNAPGAVTVTRGWPQAPDLPNETSRDHPHHKSGWFCHGDVIPDGLELKTRSSDKHVKGIDFWTEGKGHGTIACIEVGNITKGPHEASVTTQNDWNTPDGVKILDETRKVTLVDMGKIGRMLIVESDLKANAYPITFGDTKEGSFGIRISDQMREVLDEKKKIKGTGVMTNAELKTGEKNVWGYLSDWCDYSGTEDGKEAGLSIFAHPKNPSKTAWHSRAYGLMAANPFGRAESGFPGRKGESDLVKIPKGETSKWIFAIYLHTGDVKSGQVAEAYAEFLKR